MLAAAAYVRLRGFKCPKGTFSFAFHIQTADTQQ